MNKTKRYISWGTYTLLIISFSIISLTNSEKEWFSSFIEIGALILTIFLTLILSVENNIKISEQTAKHIKSIEKNTELKIQALNQATDKQIRNYKTETEKLVSQFKNNSELLAAILQRQLEDAIQNTHDELNQAKYKFNDLKKFKLLRTEKERKAQLKSQKKSITYIETKLNYFKEKYQLLLDSFTKQ